MHLPADGGDDQDSGVSRFFTAPKRLADFKAVDRRHEEVHYDHLRMLPSCARKPIVARRCDKDLVASPFKYQSNGIREVRIIVYDEQLSGYFIHCRSRVSSPATGMPMRAPLCLVAGRL